MVTNSHHGGKLDMRIYDSLTDDLYHMIHVNLERTKVQLRLLVMPNPLQEVLRSLDSAERKIDRICFRVWLCLSEYLDSVIVTPNS